MWEQSVVADPDVHLEGLSKTSSIDRDLLPGTC
jgi:hypothetical protein